MTATSARHPQHSKNFSVCNASPNPAHRSGWPSPSAGPVSRIRWACGPRRREPTRTGGWRCGPFLLSLAPPPPYPSIHPSIHLSIHPSVYLYLYLSRTCARLPPTLASSLPIYQVYHRVHLYVQVYRRTAVFNTCMCIYTFLALSSAFINTVLL
jgi:hypothetical protein